MSGMFRPGQSHAQQCRSVGMAALLPKAKWSLRPHKASASKYYHAEKYKDGNPVKPVLPHFGKYALQAAEEAWMSSRQVEKIRRILVQSMERRGKVFIRVFPHQAITQRFAESRVGATQGNIEYWVAAVKKDFILFELDGVSEDVAYHAFREASYSLPLKVKMVKRADRPSMFELEAGKSTA